MSLSAYTFLKRSLRHPEFLSVYILVGVIEVVLFFSNFLLVCSGCPICRHAPNYLSLLLVLVCAVEAVLFTPCAPVCLELLSFFFTFYWCALSVCLVPVQSCVIGVILTFLHSAACD